MARMIPNYIDQEDSKLNGERLVFEWLSGEEIKGVAMHSLLQKNHKRKLMGEVDFLLITRRGILCLEVKGGRNIYRKDGQWYSVNRNGVENLIKDPFRQAKDCMYALKNHLISVYGNHSKEANFLVGYGVIFPECIFTGKGNDLVTEVLFDCRQNLNDFSKYILRVYDYWEEQVKSKHFNCVDVLTEQDINKLVNLLRGDFAVVPSMNLEMEYIDMKIIELTEEQYDALDATHLNRKVIIQGVAGTGKSLLAIEKARRLAASNKRIAYICFNRNMAKIAESSLDKDLMGDSYVGTYHKLIQSVINVDDIYNFSVEEISRLFLTKSNNFKKFDSIIVDEAQDLMNINVLDCLDKFVTGGLENGSWLILLDPNQNIFNNNDEYRFAMDYIQNVYSPAIIPLTKNCRNTEQIGRRTAVVTLVPSAKHMKISGPKVEMRTYNSQESIIKDLKQDILSLISGGIPPEDIVILSKYKLKNSILSGKTTLCGLPLIEVEDISKFQKRALNYFTIQSFKGLESKIVFLIDVDGFLSEQNRMLNYVGMSRAKILLYVYYSEDKKEEYIEVTTESCDMF